MRNAKEGVIELAHIYHQLFKIQCFVQKQKLPSLASLLIALNYAECSETVDRPFLSEIYASMAVILFTIFPWGTTIFLGAPGGFVHYFPFVQNNLTDNNLKNMNNKPNSNAGITRPKHTRFQRHLIPRKTEKSGTRKKETKKRRQQRLETHGHTERKK